MEGDFQSSSPFWLLSCFCPLAWWVLRTWAKRNSFREGTDSAIRLGGHSQEGEL